MSPRARPRTLYRLPLIVVGAPDPDAPPRPRTRGDCIDTPRPCLYVSCKHNMYLDVSPHTGSIKLNFPDVEPDGMDLRHSCALDLAARGPLSLEEITQAMNITREGVRLIELAALAKLRATPANAALKEYDE